MSEPQLSWISRGLWEQALRPMLSQRHRALELLAYGPSRWLYPSWALDLIQHARVCGCGAILVPKGPAPEKGPHTCPIAADEVNIGLYVELACEALCG